MSTTATRNANLGDLMTMLRDQHARKVDVVAPAASIRAVDGRLVVRGTEAVLSEEGVTTADGVYVPTNVCDEGIAGRLDVPVAYLKRLRAERPDLYDANVNGWLHGRRPLLGGISGPNAEREVKRPGVAGDARSFLVRCFRADPHVGAGAALVGGTPSPGSGGVGIARAFLSDRYSVVDNLDVLMASLDGIRAAGVDVNIDGGDLTDRRMVVRVTCPEVSALAPDLLRGYRSPFTGATGDDNPTVWAGFVISNSEVGGGAFTITPRLVVEVCRNGMTMTRDALSKVHLGGRLDAGVIRWADDTQAKALELVKAQTRDAVSTFLSPEYVTRAVAALTEKAGQKVENHDEVRTLAKSLRYTDADIDGILGHFTRGGQMTRGGVVNAITAYAQDVQDGDRAYDLETRATSLLV